MWLSVSLFWQNRYADIVSTGEEGLALLGDDRESTEAVLMYFVIGMGYVWQGRLADGRAIFTRVAPLIMRLPFADFARGAYDHLAGAYVLTKEADKARAVVAHVEEIARDYTGDVSAGAHIHMMKGQLLGFGGDWRAAESHLRAAIDLWAQTDANDEQNLRTTLAWVCLGLGEITAAAEQAGRYRDEEQLARPARFLAATHAVLGTLALCDGLAERAVTHLSEAVGLFGGAGTPWERAAATASLGRACLAQSSAGEAVRRFEDALAIAAACEADASPTVPFLSPVPNALSGLEEASGSPESVRSILARVHPEHINSGSLPVQPVLQAASPRIVPERLNAGHSGPAVGSADEYVRDTFAEPLSSAWTWQDPFGDCSFQVGEGLRIAAANARDLWHLNLSAPRLLRLAPAGDFAMQTICLAASDAQPGIGGLMLWEDEKNYLVLEHGHWGAADIAFRGCLDNEDRFLGRGRLPGEQVWLRLERQGSRVRTLCSADGEEWLTAGDVEFPRREGEQVGVHAIGMIDRTIYCGAFPAGTAIRFASFAMWGT
jgi:hypothetical protein